MEKNVEPVEHPEHRVEVSDNLAVGVEESAGLRLDVLERSELRQAIVGVGPIVVDDAVEGVARRECTEWKIRNAESLDPWGGVTDTPSRMDCHREILEPESYEGDFT